MFQVSSRTRLLSGRRCERRFIPLIWRPQPQSPKLAKSPLHAETDFSRYPPPDGGRGGNKIHVSFLGDSTNLPSLWDGEMIDDILGINRPPHNFAPRLEITHPEAAHLNGMISGIHEASWAPPGLAAN